MAGVIVLRLIRLGTGPRFAVGTAAIALYVWVLGSPAPALRAALMLAIDGAWRLRQRAVSPRLTDRVAVSSDRL